MQWVDSRLLEDSVRGGEWRKSMSRAIKPADERTSNKRQNVKSLLYHSENAKPLYCVTKEGPGWRDGQAGSASKVGEPPTPEGGDPGREEARILALLEGKPVSGESLKNWRASS
jgi:hypothetical protein